MEAAFYIGSLVAILTALRVITHTNPVYTLLYLIIFVLALSIIFFSLGSNFAGALEIIIYAGAIMVLFLFAVIMLNLDQLIVKNEECIWLQLKTHIGSVILSVVLLSIIIYSVMSTTYNQIKCKTITAKEISISLFGPYVLAVELISMLLLSGLIVAFHIGRKK